MKEQRSVGRMWSLYKMGGLTPAIASMLGANNAQQMAFLRSNSKDQRQHSPMEIDLHDMDAVVFDLETTGFHPNGGDEIISFGAVLMTGDRIHADQTFYSLVNPKRDIPEVITELTGITNEMAASAPPLMDVLHDFMQFVGKRVMIAHSSSHDKQFLSTALWRTSRTYLNHRIIDTMMIAKWLEPTLPNYGLDECLASNQISMLNRHHALDDSLMTAELWHKYLQRIFAKQLTTLGDVYAYLSRH